MDSERLARIEVMQATMLHELRSFCASQDIHNKTFYVVRDTVLKREANAKGAWFTIGIFGSLTVAVSGLTAWLVSMFHR